MRTMETKGYRVTAPLALESLYYNNVYTVFRSRVLQSRFESKTRYTYVQLIQTYSYIYEIIVKLLLVSVLELSVIKHYLLVLVILIIHLL